MARNERAEQEVQARKLAEQRKKLENDKERRRLEAEQAKRRERLDQSKLNGSQ